MRHLMACLSLLSFTACDTLWAWTAQCKEGDSTCSSGNGSADMSIYPVEDLAGVNPPVDLIGVDQAGVDLANGQPTPENYYSPGADSVRPPARLCRCGQGRCLVHIRLWKSRHAHLSGASGAGAAGARAGL